jgi:hypothetical protein
VRMGFLRQDIDFGRGGSIRGFVDIKIVEKN